MVNKKLISLFKNFTLGFIIYGLITPAINKELKFFSNNLILIRELLFKLPFTVESEISKLISTTLQIEYLTTMLELSLKSTNKQITKNFDRGVF